MYGNGSSALQIGEDAQGHSQGDRLLQIKLVKQHQLAHISHPLSVQPNTMFTSPTTPIKPMAPPRSKAPGSALHNVHRQLGFGETVPASKVGLLHTEKFCRPFYSSNNFAHHYAQCMRLPLLFTALLLIYFISFFSHCPFLLSHKTACGVACFQRRSVSDATKAD